jgi:hypothetical protein
MNVPRIWVLTDRRYLDQRMPLALVAWLSGHSAPSLVIADRSGVVNKLAPPGPPDDASVWDGLRARDYVVARSRHPLATALSTKPRLSAPGSVTGGPRS